MRTLTRNFELRRKFSLGDDHNMVVRLILINAVIFTGLLFVKVIYLLTGTAVNGFYTDVVPWAVLPASPSVLLSRPWTLLTYMFVHISFWDLLSTVIWLWWFGDIIQGLAGYQKIVPLYLYGGLAGALFFLLAFAVIPSLHATAQLADTARIGAAASIATLIAAATTLAPRYRVFPMLGGGIPLYVITIIYVALDLVGHRSAGYLAAQAGGALLGILFIWQLQRGRDWGDGLNRLLYYLGHMFEPADPNGGRVSLKDKLFYKKTIPPYRRIGNHPEDQVDEILDKINRTGYDSLTDEEKDILIRASQQDN